MAVLGISNGFTNISAQTVLYEHVTPEETGSASGLFQTSRYLGLTFNQYINEEQLRLVAMTCFVLCIAIIGLALKLPGSLKIRRDQSKV